MPEQSNTVPRPDMTRLQAWAEMGASIGLARAENVLALIAYALDREQAANENLIAARVLAHEDQTDLSKDSLRLNWLEINRIIDGCCRLCGGGAVMDTRTIRQIIDEDMVEP